MIPRLGPTINPVAVYEPGTSVSRPQTRMALIETMLLMLFLTVVSHDGDNTVLVWQSLFWLNERWVLRWYIKFEFFAWSVGDNKFDISSH